MRVAWAPLNTVPCLPASPRPQSAAANLLVGGCSGTIAATICYPLDTIRRRMQMKGQVRAGARRACASSVLSRGRDGCDQRAVGGGE